MIGDDGLVDGALRLLRAHLGLDVAFVSQLTHGQRIFRHLDADDHTVLSVGDAAPVEDSYCHYVTLGEVPELLPDPSRHPVTRQMSATAEVPVGTHFSVPLILSDGTVYGTFCGFSHEVLETASQRDLDVVRLLAGMVVGQIEQEELARREQERRRTQLMGLVPNEDLIFHAQPIFELHGAGRALPVVGYELLARFPTLGEGPAEVFADAWRLGVGADLELVTIHMALELLQSARPPRQLSLNLAPDTLIDDRTLDALAGAPTGMVVEVTEHAQVADYQALRHALDQLKNAGVRIAVDDVGTGFSGLDQILRLEPDILKIDGALVRDIDVRRDKQAMVAALVTFADKVNADVVAEQVETDRELATLYHLGIPHAQGYLLGRPAPVADWQTQPAATEPGSRVGPTPVHSLER